jgi:hypothetical protein
MQQRGFFKLIWMVVVAAILIWFLWRINFSLGNLKTFLTGLGQALQNTWLDYLWPGLKYLVDQIRLLLAIMLYWSC